MTRASISAPLERGYLIRARRDRYLYARRTRATSSEAVRVGGRLDLPLAARPAWESSCFDNVELCTSTSTRGREPHAIAASSEQSRLESRRDAWRRLHWLPLIARSAERRRMRRGRSMRSLTRCCCQARAHAIATLDSALHHGLIGTSQLADVFAALPRQVRSAAQPRRRPRGVRSGDADAAHAPRARLHVELQVEFDGVGASTSSSTAGSSSSATARSSTRRGNSSSRTVTRDLALAAQGYCDAAAHRRADHVPRRRRCSRRLKGLLATR